MKKWHCFEDQSEYNNFLAWAIEGSCLEQRMQESYGGTFDIPDYWFYWKEAKKLNNETKLDEETRKLPHLLDKYGSVRKGLEGPDFPGYPDK
jgi:hypothetical protein